MISIMKIPAVRPMRTLICLLCLVVGSTLAHGSMNKNAFALNRGVNISHWLSQRGDRPREDMTSFFTEFDVIMLKDAGFDHIRLPIDEQEFWEDDGTLREDAWEFLDRALTWTERHGLRVIVDLHIIRSHYFNAANEGGEKGNTLWDDPKEQAKFVELWDTISDRIGKYPVDRVAYEFMNEAVSDDPEDWNELVRKVYAFMRDKEPNRTFVIGSHRWQVLDTLKDLWVPEGDPNLIISFHNYDPFPVTHYKAQWTSLRDYAGPIQYPGQPIPDDAISDALPEDVRKRLLEANQPFGFHTALERLQIAADFARKHDLPVYCGEWGCIIYAPRDVRLAYYQDWINAFEALDIAQAIWDYKGHFRIVNDDTREIDHELISILTGK